MCHESRDWRTLFEPAPPSLLDAQPWPSRSLEQLFSIRNQIWRMRRIFWHWAQNGLQHFHVNLWHRNCKSPTLISHRLWMINTSRHAWGWSLWGGVCQTIQQRVWLSIPSVHFSDQVYEKSTCRNNVAFTENDRNAWIQLFLTQHLYVCRRWYMSGYRTVGMSPLIKRSCIIASR